MNRAVAARVAALYEQHGAMVLAVCRGVLRDRVEAEDAAQQTFLSAQRSLANGAVPQEPASWLATIARNECLGRLRTRANWPIPTGDESAAAAPDTYSAAVRREQVTELRDALAELPTQQREAILLREVRGLSYDEVAASLSVTTSAVESLLFRARRRLQVRLREAVTAVSPVGWLMPVRELALRVGGGGGLASPDMAKVVAVGVGAAALAGGVTVTPQLVRFGRAPAPVPAPRQAPRPAPPRVSVPPPVAAPSPPSVASHAAASVAPHPRVRTPTAAVAPAVWAPAPATSEASSQTAEHASGGASAEQESSGERKTRTAATAPVQDPARTGEGAETVPTAPAPVTVAGDQPSLASLPSTGTEGEGDGARIFGGGSGSEGDGGGGDSGVGDSGGD